MAAVFKALAAVFLVVVALTGTRVSAETHHVVGDELGWGPALDVNSWLAGRVFRVGDKILFKYSETEDGVVELKGLEEFLSCNLTNPIRMYTDRENHIPLEKEGVRYFTSANPENCKSGLKLPVPVQPHADKWPSALPDDNPFPPLDPPPFIPVHPPPQEPVHPPPREPVHPPPEVDPPPFVPIPPAPEFGPPPPRRPSAAADLRALSSVLFAGMLICYMSI
ncbi:hypothetical protein CDL12_05977 [Handroanthus impetiginosus]|uniref:Phytocyanin domain-containing protein n=1 Tax=Handroanthus impetiginosus TaxID=429701 RepID=A0A2G9HUZ4_9LAMI|nr:hypothetical protein CDL12_05977 [Handroanthus impetiginosus]